MSKATRGTRIPGPGTRRLAVALLCGVLAACSDDADVPARARVLDAPAAGSQLLGVEVTTLLPGSDTSLLTLRDPFEHDARAIEDGRRYFNGFNCSGCHAPLGGGGMGPPLSDTLWIYGGEPGNIYLSIAQGRPNGMPSWKALPPEVIWKLVAYIRTLPEEKKRVAVGGP